MTQEMKQKTNMYRNHNSGLDPIIDGEALQYRKGGIAL